MVLSPVQTSNFSLTSFVCLFVRLKIDNFSLTSFICSCVRPKIHKFSLTRSLVRVYGRQGKIVRRTRDKINLSRQICSSVWSFRKSKTLKITLACRGSKKHAIKYFAGNNYL